MAIKVTLLNHTPNPEETVAMAAKLCYSASEIEEIKEGLTPENTEKFINMLSSLGHESPFEHITFTFGIEGISRACSHQLVRHRIASYSQQSQRYVDGENFEYVIPPEIDNNPIAKDEYKEALMLAMDFYSNIRKELIESSVWEYMKTNNIIFNEYDMAHFVEVFKSKYPKEYSAFEKKANEDARFILPNACTTKIVCTFNARSLFNFFKHRCCNRAQWEIREVANLMLKECIKIAPNIFANCGASCIRGKCSEGKMSCGKMAEMKEEHQKMMEQISKNEEQDYDYCQQN